ncbi:hypothetical protein L6452_28690 [Arctium lappa]|uniref:Uncharacterized protein n=1 Tax=Arctium lappa TaxID=4217 RepID=A0ACB8ZYY7_ARCLA|nr:hypothetical protein L6452_28690 [Arctium lappa]
MKKFVLPWVILGIGNENVWKTKLERVKTKFTRASDPIEDGERKEFELWMKIFGDDDRDPSGGPPSDMQHLEVWIRLHLESRSTLATWTMVLPDFMYYMIVLKDLSYLTQQCSGAQGSAGFPAWGTVNKV